MAQQEEPVFDEQQTLTPEEQSPESPTYPETYGDESSSLEAALPETYATPYLEQQPEEQGEQEISYDQETPQQLPDATPEDPAAYEGALVQQSSELEPLSLEESLAQFQNTFQALKQEIQRVIVGQDEILQHCLVAMIAGGHVLLEGAPGLGKTLLVRSLATTLDLAFQRIHFTPDLTPDDLIGGPILVADAEGGHQYQFSPGPLFCHLLLADEINHAAPKTQSTLLEAMQEKYVTLGGETHYLPHPFFVLATQSPLETEPVAPLATGQLDRFFFKLNLPYPSEEEFTEILHHTTEYEPPFTSPILDSETLLHMGGMARQVPVSPEITRRVTQLVMATHPGSPHASEHVKQYVYYGASPRAGQCCILASKVLAILNGRFHVSSEDILSTILPVLRHRLLLNAEALTQGITTDQILETIIIEQSNRWTQEASP